MADMWQTVIVIALFILAIAFIGRLFYKQFKAKDCTSGCCSADNDAVKKFRERVQQQKS